MVSSRALLQFTVVGEVGTKASEEARVEAIYECLADTDGKHLLVDERMRGCKDLSVIVKHWREDCVPGGIVVGLPDVVKSSMGLLGIPRAELDEQMIQDGRSCQMDNLHADGGLNHRGVSLCTRKIEVRVKQVEWPILEGDPKDVARKIFSGHEANVVRLKECGKTIHPVYAIDHVTGTLREFDVKFNMQNSHPWVVQGDETGKIEIHLDPNEPDILLATGGDGPIGNWQKDG